MFHSAPCVRVLFLGLVISGSASSGPIYWERFVRSSRSVRARFTGVVLWLPVTGLFGLSGSVRVLFGQLRASFSSVLRLSVFITELILSFLMLCFSRREVHKCRFRELMFSNVWYFLWNSGASA